MSKFGDWLMKNVVTNPFLNPIGAAIKIVHDNKDIKAANEVEKSYQSSLDEANNKLISYVAQQNQAQVVDEQSDSAKNVLMVVVVVILLIIILFLIFKRRKS